MLKQQMMYTTDVVHAGSCFHVRPACHIVTVLLSVQSVSCSVV